MAPARSGRPSTAASLGARSRPSGRGRQEHERDGGEHRCQPASERRPVRRRWPAHQTLAALPRAAAASSAPEPTTRARPRPRRRSRRRPAGSRPSRATTTATPVRQSPPRPVTAPSPPGALDHRGVGPARGQAVAHAVDGELGVRQLVPQVVVRLLVECTHHPVADPVAVLAGRVVLKVQKDGALAGRLAVLFGRAERDQVGGLAECPWRGLARSTSPGPG